MKKTLLIVIVVAVVVGAGAFYGGMKYGQSKITANISRLGFQNGQMGVSGTGSLNGTVGNRAGGGFVTGEIISKDDKSITVSIQNGGSKIVFFSDTTKITKSTDGLVGDLATGKEVQVTGTVNSDGSVTAQTIQLRPNILPAPASQ